MTNEEILFTIRMRNQSQAALKQIQGDIKSLAGEVQKSVVANDNFAQRLGLVALNSKKAGTDLEGFRKAMAAHGIATDATATKTGGLSSAFQAMTLRVGEAGRSVRAFVTDANNVDRAGRAFTRVREEVGLLGRVAFSTQGFLAGLGVALGAAAIVQTASAYQQLRAQLTTVTGSATAGAAEFEKIKRLAVETPFEVQNLTNAFIRLTGVGLKPTSEEFKAFGDIAAARGLDITFFAEAVADAITGEFERLKEFGIKAKQQGDFVTFTFRGVEERIRKDATSINEYLVRLGQTNFAGGMARQVDTVKGAFSNLQDAVAQAADAVGRGGLNDAIRDVTRGLTDFIAEGESAAYLIGGQLGSAVRGLAEVFGFLGQNMDKVLVIGGAIIGLRLGAIFGPQAALIGAAAGAAGGYALKLALAVDETELLARATELQTEATSKSTAEAITAIRESDTLARSVLALRDARLKDLEAQRAGLDPEADRRRYEKLTLEIDRQKKSIAGLKSEFALASTKAGGFADDMAELNVIVTKSAAPVKQLVSAYQEFINELNDEGRLLQMNGDEREVAVELLKAEKKIRSELKDDTAQLTKAQINEITAIVKRNQAAKLSEQIDKDRFKQLGKFYQDAAEDSEYLATVYLNDIQKIDRRWQQSIDDLDRLRDQDVIGAIEYGSRLVQINERFLTEKALAEQDAYEDELKRKQRDQKRIEELQFGAGAKAAVRDYYIFLSEQGSRAYEFVGNSIKGLEDSLAEFFETGELSFTSFFDAVKSGLARLAAQEVVGFVGNIIGLGGGGGAGGGLLSGISGGILDNILGKGVGAFAADAFSGLADFAGSALTGIGDFFSGLIPTFAVGGPVRGRGTGTSDDILARVSNGEFVVNARAAQATRPLLEAINSGIPAFAEGGTVGTPTPSPFFLPGRSGQGTQPKFGFGDLGKSLAAEAIKSVIGQAVTGTIAQALGVPSFAALLPAIQGAFGIGTAGAAVNVATLEAAIGAGAASAAAAASAASSVAASGAFAAAAEGAAFAAAGGAAAAGSTAAAGATAGAAAGAAGGIGAAGSAVLAAVPYALIALAVAVVLSKLFGGKSSVGPNAVANLESIDGKIGITSSGADNKGQVIVAEEMAQLTANILNAQNAVTGHRPPEGFVGNIGYFPKRGGFFGGGKAFDEHTRPYFGDSAEAAVQNLVRDSLERGFIIREPDEQALKTASLASGIIKLGPEIGGIVGAGVGLQARLEGAYAKLKGSGQEVVANLPGFEHGGQFTVGGTGQVDGELVAFRATAGERVTVDPPGGSNANKDGAIVALLSVLITEQQQTRRLLERLASANSAHGRTRVS